MTDGFVSLLDPGRGDDLPEPRGPAAADTPPSRGIPEVTRPRPRFAFASLVAGAAVATAGLVYAASGSGDPSPVAAIEAAPARGAPPAPAPIEPEAPAPEQGLEEAAQPSAPGRIDPAGIDDGRGAEAAEAARAAAESARQRAAERRRSPLLVASAPGAGPAAAGAPLDLGGPDGRFLAAAPGPGTRRAQRLSNQRMLVAQGTLIAGVLETAINSDLPGMVRAVVAADVRGFDGAAVLIPRGSRLIGQYRSGLAVGQSRAFVVWTRLITPAGVSLELGSPGTDALGRAGLTGEVDRHFGERFGAAILLSIIGSAGQAAANAAGGPTDVTLNAATSTADVADTALRSSAAIPPTVKVRAGTPIRIFVAHDLDFSGAGEGGG